MKIGTSTLQPYHRSAPNIVITAIQMTDEASPSAKVVWSRKVVDGTYSADAKKDDPTTVPATLRIRNTFLIRVESKLGYTPIISWDPDNAKRAGLTSSFFSTINMGETYYLRPRRSTTIPCGNC
jgi:Flp pilus assembly protein TadG